MTMYLCNAFSFKRNLLGRYKLHEAVEQGEATAGGTQTPARASNTLAAALPQSSPGTGTVRASVRGV